MSTKISRSSSNLPETLRSSSPPNSSFRKPPSPKREASYTSSSSSSSTIVGRSTLSSTTKDSSGTPQQDSSSEKVLHRRRSFHSLSSIVLIVKKKKEEQASSGTYPPTHKTNSLGLAATHPPHSVPTQEATSPSKSRHAKPKKSRGQQQQQEQPAGSPKKNIMARKSSKRSLKESRRDQIKEESVRHHGSTSAPASSSPIASVIGDEDTSNTPNYVEGSTIRFHTALVAGFRPRCNTEELIVTEETQQVLCDLADFACHDD